MLQKIVGRVMGGSLVVLGCATTAETSARKDLASHPWRFRFAEASAAAAPTSGTLSTSPSTSPSTMGAAPGSQPGEPGEPRPTPRSLAGYVAAALERGPEVRAAFARWQAAVHRIAPARRLPEPSLSFGIFLRSIETRVGPQRARIGISQSFPWPTGLGAASDAAAARARAARDDFEARALGVTERVRSAYWTLWQIRRAHSIHTEHLRVVRALSETVRARVATGMAGLAEQQQVDLSAARLEDAIVGMAEMERVAEARLRAAAGVAGSELLRTPDAPPEAHEPRESRAQLESATRRHPRLEALSHLAQAEEQAARREEARSYPSFRLGADWIVTTEADAPPGVSVPDSGKDAVLIGAGMQLPLWQGSYDDAASAARAEAEARRADRRAATDRALAALTESLSAVRDAARRVSLYRGTLLPQAQSAYESVLGAYTIGRGTVAQTLLAQSDLLELRDQLERARADHARAWARLESVVGRELEPTAPPTSVTSPGGSP